MENVQLIKSPIPFIMMLVYIAVYGDGLVSGLLQDGT